MTSKTKDFSQSTDEVLVYLAKNGDYNAESCLIERYRETVRITAASYFSRLGTFCALSSLEADDLFQEGLLGLLSAIYSFREEKNVTFRTYASKCISNSIKTAIKTSLRKKHIPPGGIVSIDKIDIPAGESLEERIISDEMALAVRKFIRDGLSELESSVIRLFLSELSYSDISDVLGITEKSVDNALQRARGKLNRFLEENRS